MRLFNDILKETDRKGRIKYSQGRVYLGISFFVFFVMNIILIFYAFSGTSLNDGSTEILLVVSNNIKWALATFSMYVIGSKVTGAVTDRQTGVSNDYMHDANQVFVPYNPYGGFVIGQQKKSDIDSNPEQQGEDAKNQNPIDKEYYGSENSEEIN